MNTITTSSVKPVRLAAPRCSVGITDGSERGDYVPQAHLLKQIGRPHHVINLMFQYYPDMKNWPTQGVKWHGFYRNNDLNKGDGYFPLVWQEGGQWGRFYIQQIEDVRASGQDVQLTLTLHADTPDSDLIEIARSLAPYAPMRIRINHECNGTWFYFNQRWSYGEVSDLFIRFHNILHEYAPGVSTVACWNGKGEAYNEPAGKAANGGQLTDDQLGPMFKTADIVSYDQYESLHYGWPDPDFDPADPSQYFAIPMNVWWNLLEEVHHDMCQLRNEEVNIEVHEINEDADLLGFAGQADWIRKFYREAIKRDYDWLTNITFYMFRDRGGLGLEQEDVEDPSQYRELPALAAYRDSIQHPNFDLIQAVEDNPAQDRTLTWRSTTDSAGLHYRFDIPEAIETAGIVLPRDRQLLVCTNGEWQLKPQGEERVPVSSTAQSPLEVSVYAPPEQGRNNQHGCFSADLPEDPVIVY
jgi:hypothetical protein